MEFAERKDVNIICSLCHVTVEPGKWVLSVRRNTASMFKVKAGNFNRYKLMFRYKNTNHQQMHKDSFIINCNTLLHVSTLLGHLQGELSVIVTLRLHFTVE
jgi:exonuclease I